MKHKTSKLLSILLALVMVAGLLPGQVAYAATNITSAAFSLTGAEIGQNASAISVSTSTSGLTIVDTWLYRETTSGEEPATGIFKPGRYVLQIFANAQSGYTVSGLTRENITVNGKPASSLKNPWNYEPSSHIMIVYRFELGDGSPVFLDGSFKQGTVGIPYYDLFSFSGDYPISVSYEGTLPPGLSIVGYSIKGKPTTAGTYNFKLKAQNSTGSASKDFSITIVPYTGDTLVNELEFSVSGINVGDPISNASVTTTTSGAYIIKSEWKTTDTTFSEGTYPLWIWIRPQSGYSFDALENDVITVNGKAIYRYDDSAYDYDASAWRSRVIAYVPVGGTSSTNDVYISALSFNEEQGTVTGSGKYTKGQSVTITATPKSGCEFYYWFNHNTGTVVTGAGASYTFTATEDVRYSAEFRELPKLVTISASSEDAAKGTVSGGGSYNSGDSVTITATPKEGYEFDYWTEKGARVSGAGASYTFTATGDTWYYAFFKAKSDVSTLIETVELTVTEPVAGANPQNPTVADSRLVIGNTEWRDKNDNGLSPVQKFVAGETYTLMARVRITDEAKATTSFITPITSLSAKVNGKDAVKGAIGDGTQEIVVSIPFVCQAEKTIISAVELTVTEPVAGANPQNPTVADGRLVIGNTEWRDKNDNGLSPVQKFVAGETYTLMARVRITDEAKATTSFITPITSLSAKVNGKDAVKGAIGDGTQEIVVSIPLVCKSSSIAPTITTTTLSDGKVGKEYNQTLEATGDTPITWEVVGGSSLPAGLTLAADGKISGTPTMAVPYTFTVKATNGAGSDTKSYTVMIVAADATTYTVSFNPNSGGGTMNDVIVMEGEQLTLPECTFTPPSADKEFDKWDAGNPGDKVDITSDCTITAIWKNKSVTKTLSSIAITTPPTKTTYTAGQSFNKAGMVVTATYSDSTTAPVTTYTVTPSGALKTTDTSVTISYTEGGVTKTATQAITVNSSGGSGGGGGGITTQYTLTYNTNGGSAVASTKHNSGTTVNLTATPTREGFTFDGWYADAALTSKITSIKMDGNKTVYAGWKENTNPNTGAHDCPSAHLKDVDITQWYHDGVDYVVAKKLMQGIAADQFAPNATTTRAMIVTILYRLEGEPVVSGKSGFEDVEADTWYTKAVAWAEANDIVNGYSSNRFGPMDPITREQMAAIMFRYSKFKGYDVSKSADLSVFTDNGKVSDWAVPAMKWAVAEELFKGVGDNLISPTTSATRAQVATILMRYIENVK